MPNSLYLFCCCLLLELVFLRLSFKRINLQGGKILTGGSVIESEGNFVQPTIVEISSDADVVKEELFGPVLYVMKFKVFPKCIIYVHIWYLHDKLAKSSFSLSLKCLIEQTLSEAIEINNSVPQGLSSSIFTNKPEIIFNWLG